MKTRQTKYSAYASLYILVVVAVLVAVNWLAKDHNKSFDSTSNKRFSLSDQTEKIVKGLKQDINLTYYDETRNFGGSTGGARDLLDRYNNLSSKLHVAYVDPAKKPQLARAAGIRNLGTVVIQAGDKKEEAKSVTEEEITSALIRVLKTGERNVCFVSGSGERSIDDTGRNGFSSVKEALEKSNYKVRSITLADQSKAEIPKDCTAVIIAGPRKDWFDFAVTAVKNYVENGGRLFVMLDPPLKFGKDPAVRPEGLVKMLEGWGVTVNADLAVDTSPIGQLFGFNELVPVVSQYESHVSVRDMKGTMSAFPVSSTIDVKSADKSSAEKLFSTSKNSYATTNLSSAELRIDPGKDKKGPFALAAAGTYRGTKEGRFAVIGSTDWAANSLFRAGQLGNRDIFVNLVNWLTSDEDLISIRPKDPENRPITMNRSQMRSVFFSSVIGFPLVVIASGLMVWWKRR
jgi:ABC-type uncharacterized transport system involved in gliding motility auxiliary subunit